MCYMCLVAFVLLIINVSRVISLLIEFVDVSLLGILMGKKGWKLYDLTTGDFFVFRNVQFHEN